MPSYIAAFALQQLRDMERLQQDFGQKPSRKRRRALAREQAAAARQLPVKVEQVPSPSFKVEQVPPLLSKSIMQ
jgi:hypothetical protein